MNHLERMDKGLLYISDSTVFETQKRARRLTQKLNTIDRSDFEGIAAIIKELLGKGEDVFINAREVFGLTTRNRINKGFPGHTPLFLCPEIRAVRHRMAA